jgi:hypothetical protein
MAIIDNLCAICDAAARHACPKSYLDLMLGSAARFQ